MINQVKTLLGITDDVQDELLSVIEENTIALFNLITHQHFTNNSIPEDFRFMIIEVMIKRYNRIGNEGMSQERQADLLQVFEKSDFDEYMTWINAEFDLVPEREKGRVLWR
ncbi:phage head-tail connector protein [Dolosicoccus paucivorans]|uniref:phage head-tail connector protein n=1 Tax=Dolosicoccus paucivorans TaxID=84521 RepID=UPI000882805E|nr:phage head-tail connector protein [Dolosicoccus paucivorans]SDI41058.1 Phage gp6-like head-tail connector protein [Dolosicoccus paucivorans]